MRRLIVSGAAAVVLAVTSVAVADSVGAQVGSGVPDNGISRPLPGSFIDDIEVPYDVLDYVHMTYQGHAVIRAHKMRRGGQDVYRLQIAPDETSPQTTYLFYDMKWQLLGDEVAAAPPKRTTIKEVPAEPTPEAAPQQLPVQDNSPGRGGGAGPDQEEPEPDELEEEPQEEPEQPDNTGPGNNHPRRNNN